MADETFGEPGQGHPEDTDNQEHDAVAEQAPADEERAAVNETAAPYDDSEEVAGPSKEPVDFPRAQQSSTTALSENPEVDEVEATHPDLQTEVGLPVDPNRLDNEEDNNGR